MEQVYFSIIILSHNNAHLSLVVDTIYAQCMEHDEIIIVDDHSDSIYLDKIKELTAFNNISLVHATKRGNRSHNRNLGVTYAKQEILVFVDGDMVFTDNALSILRRAHSQRTEIAFVGPKHNIHYDEEHFKLYTGITNYIELLSSSEGRKILTESYQSHDERECFFSEHKYNRFFWMHYYTGACSVVKKVFNKVNGFDEDFETWGSEDIDLGYRISQFGNIGYLPDFHSFHIPHKRNAFEIETTNMQNTLRMLNKYKTWGDRFKFCVN